jgi:hypothetical protein
MNDEIKDRLAALQAEYETGQKMLAELEARRTSVTSTLLRIEGAIHVLKELGGEGSADGAAAPMPDPAVAALRSA